MARHVVELDMENARVSATPLAYEKAEDLLPEIADIVSSVFSSAMPFFASGAFDAQSDIVKLLPLLAPLAAKIGNGRLRQLAPKILAETQIVLTDQHGEKTKYDLCVKEERATCFDERPDLYFPVLFFAGKVTFGRFFPGAGQKGKKPAALTTVA